MKQHFRIALILAAIAFAMPGCMVPAYRLPQGFSSSYHRQLYGMDPVVVGGIPQDEIAPYNEPGVFHPTSVHVKPPTHSMDIATTSSNNAKRQVMLPAPQTATAARRPRR